MKKKILVVGGTGFIGYYLCKKFIKKKYIVHSISTKKPKKIRFVRNVKYIISDISNLKKIKKDTKKYTYDYVVNVAGYVDHSNKTKTLKSHYNGCKNLFRVFSGSKLKRFIQIGSSGEYGNLQSPHDEKLKSNPTTIYNIAKKKASDFLLKMYRKNNFPITIFRLYLTYGPRQDDNRFIPFVIINCIKDKIFELSHCNQYRDFIYIDDVVSIIIKSMNNQNAIGQIFNLGTGKPIKLKSIIKKIRKYIKGGKPRYGEKKLRKDEIQEIYPKMKKVKKILGWKHKVRIDEGLLKTIKFYKNNLISI